MGLILWQKDCIDLKRKQPNDGLYPDLKGNLFLDTIIYNIHDENQRATPDHIILKTSSDNDPMLVNKIKQYFSDMLFHEDPDVRSFAQDFILYQYYSTGDSQSLNTVKISEEDRKDIGYHDFIKEEMDRIMDMGESEYLTEADIRDIFENRWYDNTLVPRAYLNWRRGV